MEHKKTYYSKEVATPIGTLVVEGPLSPEQLAQYEFDDGLVAFRPAKKQHQAVIEIADLPEGRIIIARLEKKIIGYVTFLYPDPLERWSKGKMENLIELGAIEVSSQYRGLGAGKALLMVSMMDDAMEDYIIFTTEYYWHWDLKGTGLDVWGYRNILGKMMSSGNLEWYATDDPEICAHPANCLLVRFGKRVNSESMKKFDELRFMNRFMY